MQVYWGYYATYLLTYKDTRTIKVTSMKAFRSGCSASWQSSYNHTYDSRPTVLTDDNAQSTYLGRRRHYKISPSAFLRKRSVGNKCVNRGKMFNNK